MSNDLPSRALQDPALCLAPGLFRSLGPLDRPKHRDGTAATQRPLELRYQYGRRLRFTFHSPVLLGCDDLRVLQGVVALAARSRTAIMMTTESRDCAALRNRINLVGDARALWVTLVETNFSELARAAGYGRGSDVQGGALREHLRVCLRRLAELTVLVEEGGEGGRVSSGWRLLAHDLPDEPNSRGGEKWGDIRIALNPRSSRAARGQSKHPFVIVDMSVARELKGSVARLLHQRLSALTKGKRERAFRIETLMGYAWGPIGRDIASGDMPKAGSLRKRRMTIKEALKELGKVGWSIRPADSNHPDTMMIRRLTPKEIRERKIVAAGAEAEGSGPLQLVTSKRAA